MICHLSSTQKKTKKVYKTTIKKTQKCPQTKQNYHKWNIHFSFSSYHFYYIFLPFLVSSHFKKFGVVQKKTKNHKKNLQNLWHFPKMRNFFSHYINTTTIIYWFIYAIKLQFLLSLVFIFFLFSVRCQNIRTKWCVQQKGDFCNSVNLQKEWCGLPKKIILSNCRRGEGEAHNNKNLSIYKLDNGPK